MRFGGKSSEYLTSVAIVLQRFGFFIYLSFLGGLCHDFRSFSEPCVSEIEKELSSAPRPRTGFKVLWECCCSALSLCDKSTSDRTGAKQTHTHSESPASYQMRF